MSRLLTFLLIMSLATRCELACASDTLACRQLADLVAQTQPVDMAKVAALQSEAGTQPQLKCIAHQSTALLWIRANRFSDAWKQLAEVDAIVNESSPGVRLEQAKLKLWLLVEARSPKAEEQLRAVVTQLLKADMKETELQDVSIFLGKLLKLLHGCETSCGISKATIERAKQALQTQSSQTAAAAFQAGWTKSQDWEQEMRSLLARCAGKAKTQSVAEEVSHNLEVTENKYIELQTQRKQEKDRENELDVQRLAAQRQQKEILIEMRRPTPGRPIEPRRGSSGLSRPGPKASDAEKKKYDKELDREFDDYEKEVRDYPAKLQAWLVRDQRRRELLAEYKTKADAATGGCRN